MDNKAWIQNKNELSYLCCMGYNPLAFQDGLTDFILLDWYPTRKTLQMLIAMLEGNLCTQSKSYATVGI